MSQDKSANGHKTDRDLVVKKRPVMTLEPEPYSHQLGQAVGYVLAQNDALAEDILGKVKNFKWFGTLATFEQTERDQLSAMRDLIFRYLTQQSTPRHSRLPYLGHQAAENQRRFEQFRVKFRRTKKSRAISWNCRITPLT